MDQVAKTIRTEEDARLFEKQLYLSSFYYFSKFCLKYMDLTQAVHGPYINVFESNAPRKIMVMPRGTYKSTLGSICYPIWRLLRDPNLTILLDSELYTNSKNFLRSIKAHLESDDMTRIFGNLVGKKWDEGEIIVANRTDQTIKEASITVGGIGTTKIGQHYNLIIGDDYSSPQNTETPEKCLKVIDHVRYNMSILRPNGEYVFVGTRYGERDIMGFLFSDVLKQKHLAEGKLELVDANQLAQNEVDAADNFI